MGDVIGDLSSRRGQIQGMEDRNGAKQINAFVPLSEMFGYSNDLRSKTQGRGQYVMEPSHYIEVPKSIADGYHSSARELRNLIKLFLKELLKKTCFLRNNLIKY